MINQKIGRMPSQKRKPDQEKNEKGELAEKSFFDDMDNTPNRFNQIADAAAEFSKKENEKSSKHVPIY